MINKKTKTIDFLLTLFAVLITVYAYLSFDSGELSLRGVSVSFSSDKLLFITLLIGMLGIACYCIYMAWFSAVKIKKHNKTR